MRRRARHALALVALLLVADQVLLRVCVDAGRLFGRPLAPYVPPRFDGPSALRERERVVPDVELGWRLDPEGPLALDWTGGRAGASPLAARREPGVARIVVLGGSVTLAAELASAETFAGRLTSDAREVVNLATPLHGLDQHLTRLEQRALDLDPDEVWVVFEPRAALVATTRYAPLVLRSADTELFKPRRALAADGTLERLAYPGGAPDAARALLADDAAWRTELATSEPWASVPSLRVPGVGEELLATRLLATWSLERRLDRDARLLDPDSVAFRTLVALAVATGDACSAAGVRARFLILPDCEALERGTDGLARFADALRSWGLEVLDLTPTALAAEGTGSAWTADLHARLARLLEVVLAHDP